MPELIALLKQEIEELERQIAAHPFEGLFDRKRADQLYHKLKKKRKELERLQSDAAAGLPIAPPMPVEEPETLDDGIPEIAPGRATESETRVEPPTKTPPRPKPKFPKRVASKPTARAKTHAPKAKPKGAGAKATAKRKAGKPGSIRSGAGKKRSR